MKDQGLTEHYEMENLRRKKEGKLRAGAGAVGLERHKRTPVNRLKPLVLKLYSGDGTFGLTLSIYSDGHSVVVENLQLPSFWHQIPTDCRLRECDSIQFYVHSCHSWKGTRAEPKNAITISKTQFVFRIPPAVNRVQDRN